MSKQLPAIAALTIVATASSLVSAAEDWAGFYGGASVGVGTSNTSFSSVDSNTVDGGEGVGLVTTTVTAAVDQDATDAQGGLSLGYNFQNANWVFGVEIEGTLFDGEDTASFPGAVSTNLMVADVEDQISFRGRVGYAHERWLVFGTGGVTMASMVYNLATGSGLSTSFDNETGWIAGGGVEYKLTDNLSIQCVVTHTDFGSVSAGASDADSSIAVAPNADTLSGKVGINFHF